MESSSPTLEQSIIMEESRGAEFWPFNFRDVRQEMSDYYWSYLKMLWRPESILHWIEAVELISYFENLKYPIPAYLIWIAACYGRAAFGKQTAFEIDQIQKVILNSIQDQTIFKWPGDLHKLIMEEPNLKDIPQNVVENAKLARQPSKFEPVIYSDEYRKEKWNVDALDTNMRKRYRSSMFYLHYLASISRAQACQLFKQRLKEQDWVEGLEDLQIKLTSISKYKIDKDDTRPNCSICRDRLLEPYDFFDIFETAKARYPFNVPFQKDKEQDEKWSKELEKQLEARWCMPVVKELATSFRDLRQAYYKLKAARDSLFPENVCLQPVQIDCGNGHCSFGYYCMAEWINIKWNRELACWDTENTTCPLCRGELDPHVREQARVAAERAARRNAMIAPALANELDVGLQDAIDAIHERSARQRQESEEARRRATRVDATFDD